MDGRRREGAGGKEANASITRLANLDGKDPELVNMWRQAAGLKELSQEEALNQLQPVTSVTSLGNSNGQKDLQLL